MLSKKDIIPVIIILIALVIGIQLYSSLPSIVPSHWNTQGQVDGFSSKGFLVFFMPLLALGIYALMTFLPRIDPLRKNYEKFAVVYFWFKVLLSMFFVALYLFMLAQAEGFKLNINYFILPAFSLLFILMGVMLPKLKRNWFVGIRTPWTIQSDSVWSDTHKFAGKAFITAGIISFLGIFFPSSEFAVFLTAIFTASIISVVYSYFSFKKQGGFKE
jgi:immunity protein, SdpI family